MTILDPGVTHLLPWDRGWWVPAETVPAQARISVGKIWWLAIPFGEGKKMENDCDYHDRNERQALGTDTSL